MYVAEICYLLSLREFQLVVEINEVHMKEGEGTSVQTSSSMYVHKRMHLSVNLRPS